MALRNVITAFEALDVSYQIGGSVASSVCGVPRTTLDIDLVANICKAQIQPLIKRLSDQYYISEESMVEAIQNRSSFNLIHLQTMMKIDIFILKDREYDYEAFRRKEKDVLGQESGGLECYFASAEDVILNKLEWYNMSGRISDRQWSDVLGVMKVQGKELQVPYLRDWAKKLKVDDLLEKAFCEAGLGV